MSRNNTCDAEQKIDRVEKATVLKTNKKNINKLLRMSGDLEQLAERLITTSDDAETLKLYGTVLDSAHKLRVAVKDLWEDSDEQ